jgi:AmpD protein
MMKQTLNVNLKTGLLETVVVRESPHCDDRPHNMAIDLVVIHGISLPPGEFGSDMVETFFSGKLDFDRYPALADIATLKVSSHLFIKRTGEIIQFVPFTKRAWHAGESVFAGRERCNDFSIGIELEGTDDIPYEEGQYEQLREIILALRRAYPAITRERIVGHVDIAPGRKTDPGPAFDWNKI